MVQPASKRLVTEAALPEAVRNVVEASFVAGSGITITHNGEANTITIAATGAGGLDLEQIQDAVAAMVVEGSGLSAVYDDTAGTYTISATSESADTTIVRDDFNRPNVVSPPGAPQVGPAPLITAGAAAGIDNNQLYFSTPIDADYADLVYETGAPDVVIEVTLPTVVGVEFPGIAARALDASGNDAIHVLHNGIYRASGGVESSLGSHSSFVSGADRLRVVLQERSIKVYRKIANVGNWQHINSLSLSGGTETNTKHGVTRWNDASILSRYEDLWIGTITAEIEAECRIADIAAHRSELDKLLAKTEEVGVPGTTVALIGASITYLSATNAGVYEAEAAATGYISAGTYPWANAFLGGRLTLLDNFGVGGQTSEQILDQVDSVLALPEKPTFVIVGEPATNGVYQGIETSAQVIANLDSIIDALSAEGINTVLQTNPPSDALNTAPELTAIGEVNAWIRKQNNRSGVIVADIEPYLIDPATGAPKTGVTYDGTHFANLGGLLSGKALADALRPYVGGSVDLAASNVDGRSLTLNPMMVGTAGAKHATVSGQVADSWTATWSTVGTAVCSKVSATDHVGGEWQRIQITSQGAFYFQQTISTGLVVGDVYLLEGEFRTQDWVNITTMSLELFTNLVEYRRDLATSLSPVAMPSPGWGVFRTPKYTVLPGTTYLSANVVIGGSSGIVDLRRLRIRKVVS